VSVNDYDAELYEAIKDLVDEGLLEIDTTAYGIAQHVIHIGYESLSPRQRSVYDLVVIQALRRRGQEIERLRLRDFQAGRLLPAPAPRREPWCSDLDDGSAGGWALGRP
jgi:hypothetical protein